VIKKYYWKILLVILLLANSIQAKPEIIDRKVLSDTSSNRANLFIDKDDGVFVKAGHYLWTNSNQVKTDPYGDFANGFIKKGNVHLAFWPDEQHIDIYSVGKDFTFENRIAIGDFDLPRYLGPIQVIYVPGEKDTYYLLGSREQLPRNPIEFMYDVATGGHGIYYDKPVLAEIQGQTLLKYRKVPYGGKIDESYRVKEVLTGKDRIYFIGFRTQERRTWRDPPNPKILYYAAYNIKMRDVEQTQDIYENIPYFDPNDRFRGLYWHVSADNFNDNLFIVFSWNGTRGSSKSVEIKMENINTPIYYSQNDGTTFSKAEVIGEGILPVVRADSLGNVHVIWSNSNGDIVHKVKKNDKWCDEQIVLDRAIDVSEVWEGMRQGEWWLQNMCAEFDTDNNLNVVFTSKGNLVYAKIKLN
jgi:hypothetical protein